LHKFLQKILGLFLHITPIKVFEERVLEILEEQVRKLTVDVGEIQKENAEMQIKLNQMEQRIDVLEKKLNKQRSFAMQIIVKEYQNSVVMAVIFILFTLRFLCFLDCVLGKTYSQGYHIPDSKVNTCVDFERINFSDLHL
jgi:regulator of replication initiation timing